MKPSSIVALMISCVFLPLAHADQQNCIVQALKKIESTLEAGFLTRGDQEALERTFRNRDFSPAERARKAADITFEARAKTLSPEAAHHLREVRSRRTFYQTDPVKITGAWRRAGDDIVITGPEDVRESILRYCIEQHELEHAIHDFEIERLRTQIKPRRINRDLVNGIDEIEHVSEKMAMRMEWETLHLVPESERLEIVRTLKNTSGLVPEEVRPFIQMLETAGLPFDDYLKLAHQNGRYSQTSIHEAIDSKDFGKDFEKKYQLFLKTARNGMLVTSGVLTQVSGCALYERSPRFNPNNAGYRVICKPIDTVLKKIAQ